MAGKKGNKAHANKTSYNSENWHGTPMAEKWTPEAIEAIFTKAIEIAKSGALTLTGIAIELDLHPKIFHYFCEKYPQFDSFKKELINYIEHNTYTGALNGRYNATMAIFGLKNNHGWTDKPKDEQTIDKPPKIEFIDSHTDSDLPDAE